MPPSPSPRRSENGYEQGRTSYYASAQSNQKAVRPTTGAVRPGATGTHTEKLGKGYLNDPGKHDFFSETTVVQTINKDSDGLSGVRCMAVVGDKVWIGEREGCYSVWDYHKGTRLFRSTKKRDIFVWFILGPVARNHVWVASSDSFIRVFNSETMDLVKEMKEHVGGVYALAQTVGGRLVFSGSADFTIVKWDGPKMERLSTFTGHKNHVRALLAVGKKLFSGSDDCTIRIWDIKTGHCTDSLEYHTGGVHALAYEGGQFLWSASEDGTMRVWNPENTDDPAVREVASPNGVQVTCLELVGSLIWATAGNHIYIYDPETFEVKAQFKNHTGAINALLPVHQAVVSRVWSASGMTDGVINLWDTECTYKSALSASSDGRLEEIMRQLEEALQQVDSGKSKNRELEQICIRLNGDKDRAQALLEAQKQTHEQAQREARRVQQEVVQRNVDLKQRLDTLGAGAADAAAPNFNSEELLEAYQLGLDSKSEMPAAYLEDPTLDDKEQDRRRALRDAFHKGRANAERSDDEEARLKLALQRAYRRGDTGGAKTLRKFLDEKFPLWRDECAKPIVPIAYLADERDTDAEAERKARLKDLFVEGLIDGSMDKAPEKPQETDGEEALAQWREERDAYLCGRDARRVVPDHYLEGPLDERVAYARGVGGVESKMPAQYKPVQGATPEENASVELLRSAYLDGKRTAILIPADYSDDHDLTFDERDRLRRLREHYLYGVNLGPDAELPIDYEDSIHHSPVAYARKEDAKKAFLQGARADDIVPEAYHPTEADGAMLQDAYLMGYTQEQKDPRLEFDDEKKVAKDQAYAEGWVAGSPVHVFDPSYVEQLQDDNRQLQRDLDENSKKYDEAKTEMDRLRDELADLERQLEGAGQVPVKKVLSEANLKDMQTYHRNRITVGGKAVPELPPLDSLAKKDWDRVKEIEEKYHFEPGKGDDVGAANLPPMEEMTEEEQAFVNGLMATGTHEPHGDELVAALEAALASENLSDEARKRLETLLSEAKGSPGPNEMRKRIKESNVPDKTKESLLGECDKSEEKIGGILKEVMERAGKNPDVPVGLRKEINDALATLPATETLEEVARCCLRDPNVPKDTKEEIRKALNEVEEEKEQLRRKVAAGLTDQSIPRDSRHGLSDSLMPSKSHHVPEAIREILRDDEVAKQLPEESRDALAQSLADYDKRASELATSIMKNDALPSGLHEAALGPRHELAPKVLQGAAKTPVPEVAEALHHAHATHEGRAAACEDVARDKAQALAMPETARDRVRTALIQAGVSEEDLVKDAVKLAIAHDQTPDYHKDDLARSLLHSQAKLGPLTSAVRDTLEGLEGLEELEAATKHSEARLGELVAALRNIANKPYVDRHVARELNNVAKDAEKDAASLESMVKQTSTQEGVPVDVQDTLAAASQENSRRGLFITETLRAETYRGLQNAAQENKDAIRQLNPAQADATSQAVRSMLEKEADLPARKVFSTVLQEADDKQAKLAHVARQQRANKALAPAVRTDLNSTVSNYDASVDKVLSELRRCVNGENVDAATRHELHSAAYDAASRAQNFSNVVRANALSANSPLGEKRSELREALAESSGTKHELYRSARAAAHDPEVHVRVRTALLEALGDKEKLPLHQVVQEVLETHSHQIQDSSKTPIVEALEPVLRTENELKEVVAEEKAKTPRTFSLEPQSSTMQQEKAVSEKAVSEKAESTRAESEARAESAKAGSTRAESEARAESETHEESKAESAKAESTRAESEARVESTRAESEARVESERAESASRHESDKRSNSGLSPTQSPARTPIRASDASRTPVSDGLVLPKTPTSARSETMNQESFGRLSQPVRDALEMKDDNEAVEEAFERHDSKQQKLEEVVEDELEKKELPAEAHKKLDEALKDARRMRERDPLVTRAENLLNDPALTDGQRSQLQAALDDYKARNDVLGEELDKMITEEGSPANKELLDSCYCVEDLQELVDSDALPEDITEDAVRALTRREGKKAILEEVCEEIERCLRAADGEGEGDDALREVLNNVPLPADVQDSLQQVVREDDDRKGETLATELDEDLEELVGRLGGVDNAKKLAEERDALAKLESERLKIEHELAVLQSTLKGQQASDKETAFDRALREAYLDGKSSTYTTPLPEQYRVQNAESSRDATSRKELASAWLRGRQEGLGSVVPPEYVSVEGLPEDDLAKRAGYRGAFLEGICNDKKLTAAHEEDAFAKGQALRKTELARAGARDEDPSSETEVIYFNSGVKQVPQEDVDASLTSASLAVPKALTLSKVYGRGRWIADDIEGRHQRVRPERLEVMAADKTRLAELLDALAAWEEACDEKIMRGLGFPAPTPAYLQALQHALDDDRRQIADARKEVSGQQERLKVREREMEAEHKTALGQLEKERTNEVEKLKNLVSQLEGDLSAKTNVHNSLHNRIERLQEQLGKSSAENEALTQELVKKASVGDVSELVTYYREREKKWNELSQLNRELQVENKTLLTESTALAHKLRALSFVFESRPTLVRSLYELHKLLAHVPVTLHGFSKHAKERQLPRLEILDEIREVGKEVDTCKDGTRWIIANLFTSYELQHLGTSPQFFIPDGRRPTWRDIQVPSKQRELLLATWAEAEGIQQMATPSPARVTKRKTTRH
eukprot:TRINITY_DN484_c1_g2_i4.p1 TRINITY_DN484_c1_g2~~TRINITY_DN484_c1_g2_i4.p1  ORF type:complete len:2641 (+),score=1274.29 TRINITY_DN484_c1_g2_i4:100-8022(+)